MRHQHDIIFIVYISFSLSTSEDSNHYFHQEFPWLLLKQFMLFQSSTRFQETISMQTTPRQRLIVFGKVIHFLYLKRNKPFLFRKYYESIHGNFHKMILFRNLGAKLVLYKIILKRKVSFCVFNTLIWEMK